MRPIYLISKTPYPGVNHIPILLTRFYTPAIDFSAFEGIVFTSKQAIEALKESTAKWSGLKTVCVSDATAKYAKENGALDIIVASGYGDSIPAVLKEQSSTQKWLYPRPVKVASEWVGDARSEGIDIDEVIVYETICNEEVEYVGIEPDAVLIFTSPSSVECFLKKQTILPSQTVVVIGKTTKNSLPEGIGGYLSQDQSVRSAVELAASLAQNDGNSSPF